VHAAAIDVLGPVTDPRTIHQSKFSMGFVLALIALHGRAGVNEFTDEALRDPEIREFAGRVEMVFDREAEADTAETNRWVGLVEVETTSGERIVSRVDIPKGDPGNELTRAEIEYKARRLAAFQGAASSEETNALIERAWNMDREPNVRNLLPG
jgi:2-methylcitrate dehydratase PrpD